MPITGRTPKECFDRFAGHIRGLVAKTITDRHHLLLVRHQLIGKKRVGLLREMEVFAENADLMASWDGLGYFGYNTKLHAYVEVISFDKLIDDAEKRNRVFFEKLGLPK